jgi:hypothetical protein
MEEAQTKLTDEEITGIEKKIHAALDIEQFEEAEKWVKHLKRAGMDCQKIERKIAAFRHPEPYQGRFAWDTPSHHLHPIMALFIKIILSTVLPVLAIFIQMLVVSFFCHDQEGCLIWFGFIVNNTMLFYGVLLCTCIVLQIIRWQNNCVILPSGASK